MGVYTVEYPKMGSYAPPEKDFDGAADPREVHVEIFICDDAQTPNAKEIATQEFHRRVAEAKANPGLAMSRIMLKVDRGLIMEERCDTAAVMADAIKAETAKQIQEMIKSGILKLAE